MQDVRGMILLPDPLSEDRRFGGLMLQMKKQVENTETLIFDENGRFLPRVRAALYQLRGTCRRVCIAAEGNMAGAALSIAAQLPVDEIVLMDSRMFAPPARETRAQKQLARMNHFARRNLSLVVSDTTLVDCEAAEVRQILRYLVNGSIRILQSGPDGVENLWRKDEHSASSPRSVFKIPRT